MKTNIGLDVKAITTTRQQLPLAFFEQVVIKTLGSSVIKRANINIVLVGEKKMRKLNELYRKKRGATNVLAYLYESTNGAIVGDVLVCVPVAKQEAKKYGKPFLDYIVRLLIHGTLHLMGMTHETDVLAKRMENVERVVAKKVGIKS